MTIADSLSAVVRAALYEATAEKLRIAKQELTDVKAELRTCQQQLAEEKKLRETAEAQRDSAKDELHKSVATMAAGMQTLNQLAAEVSRVGDQVAETKQAINNIPSGPSEIVFDVRRDGFNKLDKIIARGKT